MVTDTAPLRYRHYHEKSDTIDKLDFERMADVVRSVERAVIEIAGADPATASSSPRGDRAMPGGGANSRLLSGLDLDGPRPLGAR
jgi:hypothetical protein